MVMPLLLRSAPLGRHVLQDDLFPSFLTWSTGLRNRTVRPGRSPWPRTRRDWTGSFVEPEVGIEPTAACALRERFCGVQHCPRTSITTGQVGCGNRTDRPGRPYAVPAFQRCSAAGPVVLKGHI